MSLTKIGCARGLGEEDCCVSIRRGCLLALVLLRGPGVLTGVPCLLLLHHTLVLLLELVLFGPGEALLGDHDHGHHHQAQQQQIGTK